MFSILLLISMSLVLLSRFFGTVPRAPTTIGITVTFMLHHFLSSLTWSGYLSYFSISFNLICIFIITPREFFTPALDCLVGWGCRIHRLHLCREVRPSPNECRVDDTKQSDCEVPVIIELWGMQRTPSFPSLPGPLWPGVVGPNRVLYIAQIELNCILMLN